jgi:transcriptional regulator with XRE-family HTH domain
MTVKYDKGALKRLMAARGIGPTEVAALTGLARPTVSMISVGVTTPRADTLAKLARALGVQVQAFFRAA